MLIRKVKITDLPVIAEMMHNALEPYYGGNHRAHAKRIVETASSGNEDDKGHFSAAQYMYVAEDNGQIIGIINFVIKYQGTLKISPLIVLEEARGVGVGCKLLNTIDSYIERFSIRQVYCTVSEKNKLALGYFLSQGFVRAGVANNHYRVDTNEVMLYKITGRDKVFGKEVIMSVLPLKDEDKPQVRKLIIGVPQKSVIK